MFRTAIVVAVAAATLSSLAEAQGYPFSQRASVTQNVAFTEISVSYGRPVARGRSLFGALVPWDSVWHPGADSATHITFSHDVVLEGKPLPAGSYSLWLVPREKAPWTLVFNRQSRVFHKPYPGERSDALRLDITPEQGAHMETLAIYFPVVLREEAVMRIHWGTMQLPVKTRAPWKPD